MHYLEMALRCDRCEVIDYPDGYGKRTGDCGDTVEIYLTVRDDHIKFISYEIDGCINTNACANTVVELVGDKAIKEAWEITVEDVVEYLETLPVESNHCAELAVGALYLALTSWKEIQRVSWKRPYRKN